MNLLAVRADKRNQGIAGALVKDLVEFAENSLGLQRVGLFVWAFSTTAIRLYERLVFEQEGCLRKYARFAEGGFADAVVMGKVR
ncbi:MAG: GNAT family N-acetyltransferase [Ruegeria sp.]